jgi:hypothetical protein
MNTGGHFDLLSSHDVAVVSKDSGDGQAAITRPTM